MKNLVLLTTLILGMTAVQTMSVSAQSVSSGMMSGQPRKQRVEPPVRMVQPRVVQPRVAVARNRAVADPITTGSIGKKPAN